MGRGGSLAGRKEVGLVRHVKVGRWAVGARKKFPNYVRWRSTLPRGFFLLFCGQDSCTLTVFSAVSRTIGGPVLVDRCLKVSRREKTANFRGFPTRQLKNVTSNRVLIGPEHAKNVTIFSFKNVSKA